MRLSLLLLAAFLIACQSKPDLEEISKQKRAATYAALNHCIVPELVMTDRPVMEAAKIIISAIRQSYPELEYIMIERKTDFLKNDIINLATLDLTDAPAVKCLDVLVQLSSLYYRIDADGRLIFYNYSPFNCSEMLYRGAMFFPKESLFAGSESPTDEEFVNVSGQLQNLGVRWPAGADSIYWTPHQILVHRNFMEQIIHARELSVMDQKQLDALRKKFSNSRPHLFKDDESPSPPPEINVLTNADKARLFQQLKQALAMQNSFEQFVCPQITAQDIPVSQLFATVSAQIQQADPQFHFLTNSGRAKPENETLISLNVRNISAHDLFDQICLGAGLSQGINRFNDAYIISDVWGDALTVNAARVKNKKLFARPADGDITDARPLFSKLMATNDVITETMLYSHSQKKLLIKSSRRNIELVKEIIEAANQNTR